MTSGELIEIIQRELKASADNYTADNFKDAVVDALADTGWVFPITEGFESKWMKQRTKRHLFGMSLSEKADKFKFEQFNLQQPFGHYKSLVILYDEEFAAIKEEYPEKFSDALLPEGVQPFQAFGEKVDAGFAYEAETGRDITYDDDLEVIFKPKSTD